MAKLKPILGFLSLRISRCVESVTHSSPMATSQRRIVSLGFIPSTSSTSTQKMLSKASFSFPDLAFLSSPLSPTHLSNKNTNSSFPRIQHPIRNHPFLLPHPLTSLLHLFNQTPQILIKYSRDLRDLRPFLLFPFLPVQIPKTRRVVDEIIVLGGTE